MALCTNCRTEVNKEDLYSVNKSKKLCPKCKESYVKNAKEYRDLVDFMCKGFGLEAPTGHQLKTIKKLKDQGYTYIEIHKLLYYVAVVKKFKFVDSKIEIITYFVDESNTYYRQIEKSQKALENVNISIPPKFVKSELIFGVRKDKTRLIEIESIR